MTLSVRLILAILALLLFAFSFVPLPTIQPIWLIAVAGILLSIAVIV